MWEQLKKTFALISKLAKEWRKEEKGKKKSLQLYNFYSIDHNVKNYK